MAFSPLTLLNAVTPKDRGSRRVASGLAYGEGPRRRLDVYGPRGGGTDLPVVLFIYGGSWEDGERSDYGFAGRALAAQGRICVIADYRVRPAASYPAFIEDGAAALGWIVEQIARFGGDATRIGLMGHSAGAYNAAMLALAPGFVPQAIGDRIRAVAGFSGPYDFYPFDVETTRRTFGAVPDPKSTQPVNLVTPAAPPMFLGTGSEDRLVYPRNTVALAEKLRAAGVAVTERHYAGLGHPDTLLALTRLLRFRAPVLAEVDAFFRRYL